MCKTFPPMSEKPAKSHAPKSRCGQRTAYVRLVLSDFNLLKRILLKTNQYEYWQVLLTVNAMQSGAHPHSKEKRLIAKSINENFECEPITLR
jgi:hypothetical protein